MDDVTLWTLRAVQRGGGDWTIYQIDRALALKGFTPGAELPGILANLERAEHIEAAREQGGHVVYRVTSVGAAALYQTAS